MTNSETIPIESLKAIPFFDPAAWSPGRALTSLHFFVKGQWHCWFPVGTEVRRIYAWPSEASYFGDSPERPTDQSFQFLDLMHQRASFSEMHRASHGIWNDFQNFATSLAK